MGSGQREWLSAARRGGSPDGRRLSEDHPRVRARDIPFNKLTLSQSNVRRVKAGVSVDELADDIARRGLLQGLVVRPVMNAKGDETGAYEVRSAGGASGRSSCS